MAVNQLRGGVRCVLTPFLRVSEYIHDLTRSRHVPIYIDVTWVNNSIAVH